MAKAPNEDEITECEQLGVLLDVLEDLRKAKNKEAKFNVLVKFKNTNYECGCGLDTFKKVVEG